MLKKENKIDCSNLKIKKFYFLFLKMKKTKNVFDYKTQEKNGLIFEKWMIKRFKKISSLKEKEKYNATAMYMNKKNLEKLRRRMNPMVFLDIAPVECNELKNNEYGIKVEEMIK